MPKKIVLRKKYKIKKKKTFLENNFFGFFFIFSFFLFSSLYFFVFFSLFQINEINIESSEKIEKEKIKNIVEKDIRNKFLFLETKSTFLISIKEEKNNILIKNKVVKDVDIFRIFPNKINVLIEEREPSAVFCKEKKKESCFYIDKEGVVFEKTEVFLKNFPIIVSEKDFIEGDVVINKEHLAVLFFLKKELSKIKLDCSYFQIFSEKNIEVVLEKGWRILFSLDDIFSQVENLKIVLEKMPELEDKKIDYINLRFGERIYYK